MKLKIVLQPSDDGGFTVYVPSLPGCVSEGETEQEALKNIREAIELYLEPVDDDLAGLEMRSGKLFCKRTTEFVVRSDSQSPAARWIRSGSATR